jgi:hypothetical protein
VRGGSASPIDINRVSDSKEVIGAFQLSAGFRLQADTAAFDDVSRRAIRQGSNREGDSASSYVLLLFYSK